MSQQHVNKIAAVPIAEVMQRSQLPADAEDVVDGAADVPAAIAALTGAGFLLAATRVYAHALPKREAVWWACMCAQHTAPPQLPPADQRAREHAEAWVRNQADETRRAAMDQARAAGMQSPDAWAGVAAFWSGDSMMPANLPPVPPPPHLTGVAVASAVVLASVRTTPNFQTQRLERFLQSAQDIANGGPGHLPVETT